jgi:hypothetical protein
MGVLACVEFCHDTHIGHEGFSTTFGIEAKE